MFGLAAVYTLVSAVGIGLLCWHQCRRVPATLKPPITNRPLSGIDGWLILAAVFLFFWPLVLLVRVAHFFGTYWLWKWQALTVPGGVDYHPFYGSLLTFELLGNVTLLVLSVFVIVIFFQERPFFPRWFIGSLLLNFIFVGLDGAAFQVIKPSTSLVSPELVVAIVVCCVWIPYIRRSRRVRVTFERIAVPETAPVARVPAPGLESVVTNVARPKPPLRHYGGAVHMIFLWLCLLSLPLAFLDGHLKNAWTTGVSIATFVLSFVFAIVAMVKQSHSVMPQKIKSLPFIFVAGIVLFLYTALWCGIAEGALENQSGRKIRPSDKTAALSVISVVFPAMFSCLGFAGLALLISHQSALKNRPPVPADSEADSPAHENVPERLETSQPPEPVATQPGNDGANLKADP
jgi:Protein of unknown function (DUF2569)